MTTFTGERLTSGASPASAVPPLEPGDRLTRDEFERRYEAMPELKKAELIEGVWADQAGLRRTEFNFRGRKPFHMAGRWAAKTEFCTSEPKS
jgi:hypothetical protein